MKVFADDNKKSYWFGNKVKINIFLNTLNNYIFIYGGFFI